VLRCPVVLNYESRNTVVDVGAAVGDSEQGDRVTIKAWYSYPTIIV
jgi:D-arabinose 1-dehydrogenase-like Zn-dependent alcohol dehydrogenase